MDGNIGRYAAHCDLFLFFVCVCVRVQIIDCQNKESGNANLDLKSSVLEAGNAI